MALVDSKPLDLGIQMPTFELVDALGIKVTSAQAMGPKGLIVAFTCNHCPYAIAIWPRLIRLSAHAQSLGINTVAINANIHPEYPEDSPQKMAENVQKWGVDFPYLVDDSQDVAKLYQAQCTPDLYLLDRKMTLVYHGRLDDNWKDEKSVTRHELRAAVEALSEDEEINPDQSPSMGCSIKWR